MNRFTLICIGSFLTAALLAPTVRAASGANTPANEVHEIHRVIAEAADRALEPNAMHNLLILVARSDRDRITNELTPGSKSAYQAVANKIHTEWQGKYGQPFNAQSHVGDLSTLNVTFAGEGNREALVSFPAQPGEPAYELHLIREKSGWYRIELPDTITGKTFYSDLLGAAKRVEKNHTNWPANAAQAYPQIVSELLTDMAWPAKKP